MVGNIPKQICPKCGKGYEWGRKETNKKIIFFWRCSWCGYIGKKITEVNKYWA